MANREFIASLEDRIIDAGLAANTTRDALRGQQMLTQDGHVHPGMRDYWATLAVNVRVTIDQLLALRAVLKPELEATGPYTESPPEPDVSGKPLSVKHRNVLLRRLDHIEGRVQKGEYSKGSLSYLEAEIGALRAVLQLPVAAEERA
jgi:hypothetical protein